jgi:hypothetical protein
MKAKEVIPIKKEFLFVAKIVITMVVSAASALAILYLLLNKSVDISYRNAFQTMAGVYKKINIYIIAVAFTQLVFSSVLVCLFALFYSHKIAGPMFRLKAVLQQYMAGEAIDKVSFRSTDFISGVSKLFTDFFVFLGKRKKLLAEGESLAERLSLATGTEREPLVKRLQAVVNEWE